jgi:hypothetical protein
MSTNAQLLNEALENAWTICVKLSEKCEPRVQKSTDRFALGAFVCFMLTLPDEVWEVIKNANT